VTYLNDLTRPFYIEIVYQPHPLYPPLLQRRGGRFIFEGDFYPTKTLFLWGHRICPFKLPLINNLST
ncbi:hypothetical protein M1O14_04215, partial [Dehalococcoidia bacterium]|nr:hypothetical protein [Dehalococcoidia bacterium]